jgi:hypothetical protein
VISEICVGTKHFVEFSRRERGKLLGYPVVSRAGEKPLKRLGGGCFAIDATRLKPGVNETGMSFGATRY